MDRCDPPERLDLHTTDAEHDIAVRAFVALWHGQQPRPADIDADPALVDALQPRGLVVLAPDGRITGMHGLSTTPTSHRITHDGRTIHTWCAFDAIGIPAALGLDAHTETTCPTCGHHLAITFTHGLKRPGFGDCSLGRGARAPVRPSPGSARPREWSRGPKAIRPS